MKKYKKIYIEITNICNLNCSFCGIDDRKKEFMSLDNFEKVLKKINNYTDYIYLHVKGEPLLHPDLKEILELANKYNLKVKKSNFWIRPRYIRSQIHHGLEF